MSNSRTLQQTENYMMQKAYYALINLDREAQIRALAWLSDVLASEFHNKIIKESKRVDE